VSDDPPMLIDGPIPSTLISSISVTFLLRFPGALPWVLDGCWLASNLRDSPSLLELRFDPPVGRDQSFPQ
jgi:hypothetical protein